MTVIVELPGVILIANLTGTALCGHGCLIDLDNTYRAAVPPSYTEVLERYAIPTASTIDELSSYLRFSAYSVTLAYQTIIDTTAGKCLTTTHAAVTVRSSFTVAMSASIGNQDLVCFCPRNAQHLLESDGVLQGCSADAQRISPSSAPATTTKTSNPATPISDPSVAASSSALLPSAVDHHRITS